MNLEAEATKESSFYSRLVFKKRPTCQRDLIARESQNVIESLYVYKTTKSVLRKLADYFSKYEVTFVGQKKLADDLKISLPTLKRHLKILYEAGIVSRRRSRAGTNEYTLHFGSLSVANFSGSKPQSRPKKKVYKAIKNDTSDELQIRGIIDISIPSKSPLKNAHSESQGKDTDTDCQSKNERKVVSMFQLTEEDAQKAQKMIRTMESATNGVVKVNPDYASSTPSKLVSFLKNKFDGDMRRWEAFCKYVGSSSLMRCKNGFVPALLWLIHDKQVKDLRRGIYHKHNSNDSFSIISIINKESINDNANSSYKTQINKYDFLENLKCDLEGKNLTSLEEQITKVKIHIINSKRFLEGEYVSWFQHMKPVSFSGDTVTVQLPNPFFVDYFKSHFKERLEEIWIKENPESSVKFIEFVADQHILVA